MNFFKNKLQFNRNEFSGAFGDIGTDLPLLLGMIWVTKIDGASVFIVYGCMQLISALIYGIPMAVQPLKAVATIVIAGNITGDLLFAGGFIIGLIMLILTLSGAINVLSKLIPLAVIRGVQVGLGLTLASIAVSKYMLPNSTYLEYCLLFLAFLLGIIFIGNRKYPPAIFLFALGILFSVIHDYSSVFSLFEQINVRLPIFQTPDKDLFIQGIILLALPQIPLSLGNSIFASKQLISDYFPEKKISASKISFTYSLMNLIAPFFGGIPVCHGSGGLVGHYNFGARTGGSVFIYGLFYILIGMFFNAGIHEFFNFIPLQILGVILFFEAISLISLVRFSVATKKDLFICVLVALIATSLPYGFLISMVIGTIVFYSPKKLNVLSNERYK